MLPVPCIPIALCRYLGRGLEEPPPGPGCTSSPPAAPAQVQPPEHTFSVSQAWGGGGVNPILFSAVLQQDLVLGTLPRMEGKGRNAGPSFSSPFVLSNFSKTTSSARAGELRMCQPCSREEGHSTRIRSPRASLGSASVVCVCGCDY